MKKQLSVEQLKGIDALHRKGIVLEFINENECIIKQIEIKHALYNQKQIHRMGRELFNDVHFKSVTYKINFKEITVEKVLKQLEIYGIKRNDLIKNLGLTFDRVNTIYSGNTFLTPIEKSMFFYYLQTLKLSFLQDNISL